MLFKKLFILFLVMGVVFSLTPVATCMNLSTPNELYVVQNDLFLAGGNCINVTTDNVTLDCGGYGIYGSGAGAGIFVFEESNVTVANCTISGFNWGMNLDRINDSLLYNNTIYNSSDHCLVLDRNNRTTVAGYEAYNCTDQAVYARGADYLYLSDIYMHDTHAGICFWEGQHLYVDEVTQRHIYDSGLVATEPGVGVYFRDVQHCSVSNLDSYNTSSLAIYLWGGVAGDLSYCNISNVYAEFGAYDALFGGSGSDGLVSMYDTSYFDPAEYSSAWNITVTESYAIGSNFSGGIGISATHGIVENLTSYNNLMSGMGIVLGNGSFGQNYLGYDNGVAGVAVICGLQDISGYTGQPNDWDPWDEGDAQLFNVTGHNNGWIGVVPILVGGSNITGIVGHSTDSNHWNTSNASIFGEICDPMGMGFCLVLTNETRFGGAFAGLELFAPLGGSMRNVHYYNSSIGGVDMGMLSVCADEVVIHNNSIDGLWVNNSANAHFRNMTIYDNAQDGISIQENDSVYLVWFNNTEVYSNGRHGIWSGNFRGGFGSGGIILFNSSIHNNPGYGWYGERNSELFGLGWTEVRNNGLGGISLESITGLMMESSQVYSNTGTGIEVSNYSEGVLINNSEVYLNTGDGISFSSYITPVGPTGGLYNASLHHNTGSGLVFGGVGLLYGIDVVMESNAIGLELADPYMPMPDLCTVYLGGCPPYPNSGAMLINCTFDSNGQDFAMNKAIPEDNPPLTEIALLSTFGNTYIGLDVSFTNDTVENLYIDSRAALPASQPATYDSLGLMFDMDSTTGLNVNMSGIIYTDADIVGRNESNLQVLDYSGGTWSVVPDQENVTIPTPFGTFKAIGFYNFSTFSTFALFENSTEYTPPSSSGGDGKDQLKLIVDSPGHTLDEVTFTVTVDDKTKKDIKIYIQQEGKGTVAILFTGLQGTAVFIPTEAGEYTAEAKSGEYLNSDVKEFSVIWRQFEIGIPSSINEDEEFSILVKYNGEPVEGALVSIDGNGRTTGQEGRATFSLSQGTYEVTVSKEGYEQWEGTVRVAEAETPEPEPEPEPEQTAPSIPIEPEEPVIPASPIIQTDVPSVESPIQPVDESVDIQQYFLWFFLLLLIIVILGWYYMSTRNKGKKKGKR